MSTHKGVIPLPDDLIEVLMSEALSRNEARVLLFIARKTYGWNKSSDQISLSQFQEKLGLSRQGVVSILKRLELVKLCRLVNKGNSRLASSEWTIDLSNYPTKLVKLSGLVKFNNSASLKQRKELVNIGRHTISISKDSNKESNQAITSRKEFWDQNINSVLRSIKGVTPDVVNIARAEFIVARKFPPSTFAMKSFILQKQKTQHFEKGGVSELKLYGKSIDPFNKFK